MITNCIKEPTHQNIDFMNNLLSPPPPTNHYYFIHPFAHLPQTPVIKSPPPSYTCERQDV